MVVLQFDTGRQDCGNTPFQKKNAFFFSRILTAKFTCDQAQSKNVEKNINFRSQLDCILPQGAGGWGRLYSFLWAVLNSAHPQTTQRFNTAFVVIKFKSINARLSHASFELAKMPGLTQPLRQDYGNPHSKKKVGLLSGVASTNTDP